MVNKFQELQFFRPNQGCYTYASYNSTRGIPSFCIKIFTALWCAVCSAPDEGHLHSEAASVATRLRRLAPDVSLNYNFQIPRQPAAFDPGCRCIKNVPRNGNNAINFKRSQETRETKFNSPTCKHIRKKHAFAINTYRRSTGRKALQPTGTSTREVAITT